MVFGATSKKKTILGGSDYTAVLDVGSSKMCCLIARMENGKPNIISVGHQASHGVRNGIIVDIETASSAMGSTIQKAEQLSLKTIDSVFLNLCGGQPSSHNVAVEVAVNGGVITNQDVIRAQMLARQQLNFSDSVLIHSFPVSYSVDGSKGIKEPRGMYGTKLGIQLHDIFASRSAVLNLGVCVEKCLLDSEGYIAPAYAAGLSCLVKDEMDLGSVLVDMGGGSTSFAVFYEGYMVHMDSIPIGGSHVTNDIARGLTTSLNNAERMKILHGDLTVDSTVSREMLNVPLIGEEEASGVNQIPKSALSSIIRPRMEELFEILRERLEAGGFSRLAGNRVVLTGGASQLKGVKELAQLVLEKQVRYGKPQGIRGLPEEVSGPAFSVSAGMLLYAAERKNAESKASAETTAGLAGRFGKWLKDNL